MRLVTLGLWCEATCGPVKPQFLAQTSLPFINGRWQRATILAEILSNNAQRSNTRLRRLSHSAE